MAQRPLSSATAPKTYAELKRGVEAALLTGQRNVEQAKVRTYWETGRLIHEHVLLFRDRGGYGADVFSRLARDLAVSKRVLYQCTQFARAFPNLHARAQLTWAHYRVLSEVPDPAERKALAAEAAAHGWTSRQIEERVRLPSPDAKDSAPGDPAPSAQPAALLTARHGTPGLHVVANRGDGLVVDLGFKLYRPLSVEQARRYAKGDIVRLDPDGSLRRDDTATKGDLFTYAATVLRVIDGDTLVVSIRVTPGVVLEEKLRLRGLDCPELDTAAGKAAKRFVDGLLAPGAELVLTTTKPDKYDRYLADVFLSGDPTETRDPKPQTPSPAAAVGDTFLNNALLAAGHAVTKTSYAPSDWDEFFR